MSYEKAKPSVGVNILQGFGPTMIIFLGGKDIEEAQKVAKKVMPPEMIHEIFDPVGEEPNCAGFCIDIGIEQEWIDKKSFKFKDALYACIVIVWTDLPTLIHECVHAMCTMSEEYHDEFSEETKCRLVGDLVMIGLDSQDPETSKRNGFNQELFIKQLKKGK